MSIESRKKARLKYKQNNPDKVKESNKRYREAHKQEIKLRTVGYRRNLKNTYYKCKYKITLEDYQNLLEQQQFVCAICSQPESTKNKDGQLHALCVDHCHTTGKVRGLLCRLCNSALGKFKDNKELLLSAVNYLNRG